MMLPSITPMVLSHARLQEARREGGRTDALGANALFVAGYLVAWTAAGLLGFRIEPPEARAGALPHGLRLRAQLLRHQLAGIAGGGVAGAGNAGERGGVVTTRWVGRSVRCGSTHP
jgi:predicted metal-binding membrane protein